jgi:GTP-binding protein HflX
MRRVDLPDSLAMVLADTVGFVRHLPHQLVEAFRATLEEARLADLLLHVIDASAEDRDETTHEVEQVLAEIGAADLPRLDVFNKIDLLEAAPRIDRDEAGLPVRVWVSAKSGAGMELLREAIAERVGGEMAHECLELAPSEGRLRALLYGKGAVVAEQVAENGSMSIEVRLPRRDLEQLLLGRRQPASQ